MVSGTTEANTEALLLKLVQVFALSLQCLLGFRAYRSRGWISNGRISGSERSLRDQPHMLAVPDFVTYAYSL